MHPLLEPLLQSPELGTLLNELQETWQKEQEARHLFWANADESVKAEFIAGEIIYHSPVYGRHWKLSTRLITQLLPYVYAHKLGEVAVEKAMVRCTRNDYEPDICFWKTERAQHFKPLQSVFPPPDFIVEILSQSTEERDRGIKFIDYALHGVAEYWIIDPDKQTIEQYLLLPGQTKYQLEVKLHHTGTVFSQVINGFSVQIDHIFAE
ncbi:Uma2 family endonuclease [Sphingobacteriales bacterium UPWRP_1]|nr:hypothetical protein B6N25_16175 [Sphingobacteriales bacterium TSM_CSS]PSJ71844.1 Uma2 family endonuclease [Sphingobacteriales bacterium UPWRP_1]